MLTRRSPRARTRRVRLVAPLVAALLVPGVVAQEPGSRPGARSLDLQELSLRDLLSVRLTSASRRDEALSRVPAAAHVITSEDIRRAGARSIPDLLRGVPGLHVAQLNASTWAVGSRGFADTYSDKLLVLVDGRSVYTPLFSGVSWDSIDVPLGDIERIEVLRGPGAAMWGANAVNGVINIILKSPAAHPGGHVKIGAGSDLGHGAHVRHAARVGRRMHLGISARSIDWEAWEPDDGLEKGGDWRSRSFSARLEADLGARSRLTFLGGAHSGSTTQLHDAFGLDGSVTWSPGRVDAEGAHALLRWTREPSPGRGLTLQAWVSEMRRDEPDYLNHLHGWDFELTKRMPLGRRHDLTWGLGWREARDEVEGTSAKGFVDGVHSFRMLSAFAKDDIRLSEDVALTVAARVQRDESGDVTVQPTVRVAWQASDRLFAWGAISRALRSASRIDRDARLIVGSSWDDDLGLARILRVEGHGQNEPEWLESVEAGFRWSHGERLALDVAAFASRYDGLRTYERGEARLDVIDGTDVLLVPVRVDNLLSARSLGLEVAATWRPLNRLRLRLAASAIDVDFTHHASSDDIYWNREGDRGNTPRRRARLVAQIELPRRCELDVTVEHAAGWIAPGIRDYTRVGFRFGWRPVEALELELGLRDALSPRTREHSGLTPFTHVEPAERAFHLSLTWKF